VNPQPPQPDWLDNESIEAARTTGEALRVEFARQYLVFEQEPRAVAIFEHWKKTLLLKRTPVGASILQYAADEAIRAFIGGILEETRIAREGKA
jgi:hypothetical protein